MMSLKEEIESDVSIKTSFVRSDSKHYTLRTKVQMVDGIIIDDILEKELVVVSSYLCNDRNQAETLTLGRNNREISTFSQRYEANQLLKVHADTVLDIESRYIKQEMSKYSSTTSTSSP